MKIKLAILEKDKNYLSRIVSVFGTKYADKCEIYSFTDQTVAMDNLNSAKIDILVANDGFDIDVAKLPNRCGFAYLVDSSDIEMVKDQRAICKFQKADLIYKQILNVYSEKASTITGFKMTGDVGQVIAFGGAAGGVGSSSMAAACAMRFATNGYKVLYLNLETFGASDVYFSGQGQFDMSDIIFALKSKKANLPLKLESCVRQDSCGVYFYTQPRIALDMMELNADETVQLIAQLKLAGEYDYIILDLDFGLDQQTLKLYREAQSVVLVCDGSAVSNQKSERAFMALSTLESNADAPLTNRMYLAYDKVSSKNGQSANLEGLKVLGGAPRYAGADARQVVEQLAALDFFDSIL